MRGLFADICVPLIIFFLIGVGMIQCAVSYSCYQTGNMYNVETKTASFECYINSPIGWIKQADFEIARIMGKL